MYISSHHIHLLFLKHCHNCLIYMTISVTMHAYALLLRGNTFNHVCTMNIISVANSSSKGILDIIILLCGTGMHLEYVHL